MQALDLTTIIIACISVLTLVINGIINYVKSKRQQETTYDKEQWELINKLIDSMVKKQNEMCKSITALYKKLKEKGQI